MYLTEEEAKTKWCPFARQGIVEGVSVNRDVRDDVMEGTMCFASSCMAWREITELGEELRRELALPNQSRPEWANSSTRIGNETFWLQFATTQKGFCGLAGRPE